jgi:hypothetical protein
VRSLAVLGVTRLGRDARFFRWRRAWYCLVQRHVQFGKYGETHIPVRRGSPGNSLVLPLGHRSRSFSETGGAEVGPLLAPGDWEGRIGVRFSLLVSEAAGSPFSAPFCFGSLCAPAACAITPVQRSRMAATAMFHRLDIACSLENWLTLGSRGRSLQARIHSGLRGPDRAGPILHRPWKPSAVQEPMPARHYLKA